MTLTAIGLLLLAISLGGVALGLYMAADRRTREGGLLFAVLWIPGLAAASGILMRDVVSFTVGALCLLAAGAVFVLRGDKSQESKAESEDDPAAGPAGTSFLREAEKITRENKTRGSGRAAS